MTSQDQKAEQIDESINKKSTTVKGRKTAEKTKKTNGKKFFTKKKIIIFSSIAALLIAAAIYLIFFTNVTKRYDTANQVGDVLSNGTIEVTFLSVQTTTNIIGYDLDSDYVYVELLYTVKNVSGNTIAWKKFPYVSIMQYEKNGTVYKQIKDSEANFDFNALQSYALTEGIDYSNALDDMQADEIRTDSDVVIIPADAFDTDTWFVTIDNIDAIVQINLEETTDTETDTKTK